MPRTQTLKPEQVPADSKPTLDTFTKMLRFTPNMLATFAQSPIAFNAWATFPQFPEQGALTWRREKSSASPSLEVNGCNYCLAVHSYAASMAKLPADEIILARKAMLSIRRKDAAVQFAHKIIETRGQVGESDLETVRQAGYTDANVMEIVALVAMYSLTNFFQ